MEKAKTKLIKTEAVAINMSYLPAGELLFLLCSLGYFAGDMHGLFLFEEHQSLMCFKFCLSY